jgi:peptide/nickel transport system substrate-binding protein
MRRFLGAAAVCGVLFAAACGGSDDGAKGRAGELAASQKLRVGAGEDAYVTEGDEANVGQYPLNANIFESLVRMTPDYEIVPALATDWEFRPPNTWRFTLRQGVRFHDGTPFTAEAVKYTFDRIARTGGGTPGLGPRSTKIVDDYTVEITPKFQNRRLVEQLVHPNYSIIAPGSDPGTKPIGTGPFRFVSYSPEEQIVVERNDDYWGEPPILDEITFRFIPEPNARRLALEAGEVDLIVDPPRESIADLEAKGFVIAESEVGAYEAMYAKITAAGGYDSVLRDRNVRLAIAHAVDRDALVEGVFEGLAAPEQTMVPSRLLGEHAEMIEGFPYDPARAEELLEQAGWTEGAGGVREKDGRPLELLLIDGFPSAQAHGAVPEFIQDQLSRVGIGVKIVKTPDSAAYEERLAAGDGDLWLEQGNQNDANPAFLPALLFWSEGLFGDIGYQPHFAPGGVFDELIVEALAHPDSDEVKRLVGEAMHVLIDQEAVVIPLAGIFRINAMTDKVQGFSPHPSGLQVRYDAVSIVR